MFAYYWSKIMRKIRGAAIKNSTLGKDTKVEAGTQFLNSTMGRHSFCGYDCFIHACDIGSFVSIADCVTIGCGEHPLHWVSTSPVFYDNRDSIKAKFSRFERDRLPRTTIGNDVWIGHGCHIKAGVKIGNGAVVGMGSVVTRDVGDYAIVAGVPARMIRKRFDDDVIHELEQICWWDMEDDQLREYAAHITNPRDFLSAVKSMEK